MLSTERIATTRACRAQRPQSKIQNPKSKIAPCAIRIPHSLLFTRYSFLVLLNLTPALAQQPASSPSTQPVTLSPEIVAGLSFRAIGPALASGRIGDFAVHPQNRSIYYVAVSSGGVWKTTNGGTTFSPIFDSQGSFSIGCLALDPKNPSVLYVGTGENNSQRSVAFGDGLYRTRDGGKNWENLGLRDSEHIGMIAIDPRDSDTLYVAAQGPLWRPGPDRGLYKSTDAGKIWKKILDISENTGVSEIHIHPRDPDTLLAVAYQRRRHVWTLINGGPESAIYKSDDAGESWRKITVGLPDVDLGRIGLAISPANPDIVYAIVEAAQRKGGIHRSLDRGETWEKRNDYMTSSGQYYNELFADPANPEHFYAVDTFLMESWDGGKTMRRVNNTNRHVDDHVLWIDPANPLFMLVGCDGGIYETHDRGESWRHMHNLPVTQFYRVAVDNAKPFYNVYGGTQDNNTMGGPSRTIDEVGIVNDNWFVTVGGDGFEPAIDPEDHNIVYSQWQHGGLVRHDRRSGETIDIKPREKPGEPGLRWNWDSPLLISPHDRKRLYFAANILFRSDDQGDSWTAISPDLTRQIDRNQLQVMGKVQLADAVAKSDSTSFYGNIVSLSESPLVRDLLYVGTDDGLVQVTDDGGKTWRRESAFPGIPDLTYVSCLRASQHEPDVVYATFDNHKMGDFQPYILKSADRGKSWKSIAGDIPDREIAYSVAEDHVDPKLLFAGTEFGVFFTRSEALAPPTSAPSTRPSPSGYKWIKLKAGIPTIAVRDIDIQELENDLVLATFGRGFYILDDYSPLRHLSTDTLQADAHLLPVKDALHFVKWSRLGGIGGKGWLGASYWSAPNPPFGATFTLYLKEKLQTRREKRHEDEKKAASEGRTPTYPTIDQLRAEDEEREPQIILTVRDAAGSVVRRLNAKREKGLQRINWDLRFPSAQPTNIAAPAERAPWDRDPEGPLASPGDYSVALSRIVDGVTTDLGSPQKFKVVPLNLATFAAKDKEATLAFRKKVARLQRAAQGASRAADEASSRLAHLRKALLDTPAADPAILGEIESLQKRLADWSIAMRGDPTRGRRNEPQPPSIIERVETVAGDAWYATSPPTKTQQDGYAYAADAFTKSLADLRTLIERDLKTVEDKLEKAGAPWTPGRLPTWVKE